MSKIFLDNQSIQIEGPLPKTSTEAYQILIGYLSTKSRLLQSFKIEGKEYLYTTEGKLPKEYTEIRAISNTEDEIIRAELETSQSNLKTTIEKCKLLSEALLSQNWDSTLENFQEIFKELENFINLSETLYLFTKKRRLEKEEDRLKSIHSSLGITAGELLKLIEEKKLVDLSNTINDTLIPILQKLENFQISIR